MRQLGCEGIIITKYIISIKARLDNSTTAYEFQYIAVFY